MFLGGFSCFTSRTADLGNDFKTPFTERHLILIDQKSWKAHSNRVFPKSILLWHHILLKGTLMSGVIQPRAIQKIWEWSQQDSSQVTYFVPYNFLTNLCMSTPNCFLNRISRIFKLWWGFLAPEWQSSLLLLVGVEVFSGEIRSHRASSKIFISLLHNSSQFKDKFIVCWPLRKKISTFGLYNSFFSPAVSFM